MKVPSTDLVSQWDEHSIGPLKVQDGEHWRFAATRQIDDEPAEYFFLHSGDTVSIGRPQERGSRYPLVWTAYAYRETPSAHTPREWNEMCARLPVQR